ncbi:MULTISPECIES: PepSY domain-containing protein [unclassified Streptomyces]|uniref:PepSY domain-containing protein n=1 Tax=unclassified Streptomyces TaxID=2593676 RepID=UPI0024742373|nr:MULTISPECIES: PepSY domain-containing protein [unclassified Streptomyces]MDH6452948.1 putative membrane protein YkoI [Streptomyces sp. SAI-119]MDH6496493.1 putative membrane protein YkoI [Streptomyces sp. SAI-149]
MKRNIVIATLTAAALATGGTVAAFAAGDDGATATQRQTDTNARTVADRDDDSADDRDDSGSDDRDDNTSDDDRTAVRGGGVTAAEAIAAALRHTPGTALSADLDDGADAWEVTVVKGDGSEYDVRIAPDSGKVLGAQRDTDDDNDADDRAELAAVKGATTDAGEAALAAAAKGTVTEVGLDDDNGAVAWGVDTVKDGKQSDWKVALDSGKVTQDRDED